MKRNLFAIIFLIFSVSLFGEENFDPEKYEGAVKYVESVNRKTALRCMKVAEKRLLEKDWNEALTYAKMAISYDDTFSDVYYIKAAAELNLDYVKKDVLDSLENAFEKNEWVGYNKNGARILYADMLSEIGEYEHSMEILDEAPFIYSADAEFIRVKNGYRIGTSDTIEKARDRVFSARRVYPKDSRFIDLFFMFEGTFKNLSELHLTEYTVPSVVQKIANEYISQMPYRENPTEGIDVLATMFASEEDCQRLLKAIGTREEVGPLYPVIALKAGILSEEAACNQFFEYADSYVNIELLELFVSLLEDENALLFVDEHLTAYNGTLGVDMNLDFINELDIKYERGRPKEIHYDINCDGVEDLFAICDFGSPVSLKFPVTGKQIYYSIYPQVENVVIGTYNEIGFEAGSVFNFVNDDLIYSPFEMTIPAFLSDNDISFYVPFIISEMDVPSDALMSKKASSIGYGISERENASVILSFAMDDISAADFYWGGRKYAYSSIDDKNYIIRHLDSNNDGIFETTQYFNHATEENPFVAEPEDEILVEKIFGNIAKDKKIYLEKVEIDSTGDLICNYSEEYQSNGGRIVTWDFDGDGLFDIRYTKFPGYDDLLEESEFRNFMDKEHIIKVTSVDGIPFKLSLDEKELNVTPGFTENVYWVGEDADSEEEETILKKLSLTMEQAVVTVIDTERAGYFAIRVGSNYFLWQ